VRRSALALAALLVAACSPPTHRGTGRVEEVRPDLQQLVLAHDEIEGLMPAMTMNLDVASPALLSGLAAGDQVVFELSTEDGGFLIVAIEKLDAGVAGVAGTSGGAGLEDVVAQQDPAPDFELVDQDGAARSLASLRGRLVLLDFIYTHCPGPCPILTGTHVGVQRKLPEALRDQVWFASISLDPERDSPERMREYGEARGVDFDTWSFLTGPKPTIDDVLERYGVGSVPDEGGEIQHVVVSVLIDREGQIRKRYFGLSHDADEFLRDLERAAES
jgi:protein SCO1/2